VPAINLRAEVARELITPQKGIYLIGYADRAKGIRGVHDDLTATALVLDNGHVRLALVALDLLCLNECVVDRIRRAVELSVYPILCCSQTRRTDCIRWRALPATEPCLYR
jgi:hypothetical protein